jgi:hypothetical protein
MRNAEYPSRTTEGWEFESLRARQKICLTCMYAHSGIYSLFYWGLLSGVRLTLGSMA